MRLPRLAQDDSEALDFVHLLPEALYVFVKNTQAQYHGWRNNKLAERRDVFDALKSDIPGTDIDSFEDFDELMRLDLERLRSYAVDYQLLLAATIPTPSAFIVPVMATGIFSA